MKVGFTGTREGMSQNQLEQLVLALQSAGVTEFHHGDCLGADAEAHDIIREFFPDCKIIVHPPVKSYMRAWKRGDQLLSPLDYIARDRKIVESTDFLIGAPLVDVEQIRSGTWTTIRHARRLGRDHVILVR